MWLKVICKYLALYFDLWSKLYYIYLNFHSSENITLQSKISLRKQYNLPLGKYSCGVAINPYRYATNSLRLNFYLKIRLLQKCNVADFLVIKYYCSVEVSVVVSSLTCSSPFSATFSSFTTSSSSS